MKRTGQWTERAAGVRRAAAICLLISVVIGCASVRPPSSSAPPGSSIKKSSEAPAGSSAKAVSPASYQQGIAYFEQGQFEAAQRIFESLIFSHPDRIEFHNALGVLFRRRGMPDKAVSEYTMAISIAESSSAASSNRTVASELYNNLAIAHRESGKFKTAEEAYRKAITLNPNFATAYYNLGVLYDLYLNQPLDAVQCFREFERLAGRNQTVDVWIADLEQRIARRTGDASGRP